MRREILNLAHLLALVTLGLGIAAVRAQGPAVADPTVAVAIVNNEIITLGQLEATLKQRPPAAPLSTKQLQQVRAECVNEMIDDLLLRQFLRKHGPKIEPVEIDRHFKALNESLAKQNKTTAEFFRDIGQTEAQARETWTAMLQLSRYVREHVSDEQLKAYYIANKDFFDRVEVKVSHIMLRPGKKGEIGRAHV